MLETSIHSEEGKERARAGGWVESREKEKNQTKQDEKKEHALGCDRHALITELEIVRYE